MPFGALRWRWKDNTKAGLRQIGYEGDRPRNWPNLEEEGIMILQNKWDLPSNTALHHGFTSSTLCKVILLFYAVFDLHRHTNSLEDAGLFLVSINSQKLKGLKQLQQLW
jgi:hypothetical protein